MDNPALQHRSSSALHLPLLCTLLVLLSACPQVHGVSSIGTRLGCMAQPTLVCRLRGTSNRPPATGVVQFYAQWWGKRRDGRKCGIVVRAVIQKLRPGKHGFHIHTYGDVRRDDGKLAGGHFANPYGVPVQHGFPADRARHWGDLGNVTAWKDGNAGYTHVDFVITIKGIVGRSIVIHQSGDKGPGFQPSGDAGKRVAQCVIGYANPDGMVL